MILTFEDKKTIKNHILKEARENLKEKENELFKEIKRYVSINMPSWLISFATPENEYNFDTEIFRLTNRYTVENESIIIPNFYVPFKFSRVFQSQIDPFKYKEKIKETKELENAIHRAEKTIDTNLKGNVSREFIHSICPTFGENKKPENRGKEFIKNLNL